MTLYLDIKNSPVTKSERLNSSFSKVGNLALLPRFQTISVCIAHKFAHNSLLFPRPSRILLLLHLLLSI